MSNRTTKTETDRLLTALETALRNKGILSNDEYLSYQTGNSSYGYAWRVSIREEIKLNMVTIKQDMDDLATHGTRKDFHHTLKVAESVLTFTRR